MGFGIYAYDEDGNEIAYLRAYMGAFRMCKEQGYDWFNLIDETRIVVLAVAEEKKIFCFPIYNKQWKH